MADGDITPPVVEDSATAMAALLGTELTNDDGTPITEDDNSEDNGDEELTPEQQRIAELEKERDKFKTLSKNNEKGKKQAQAALRSLRAAAGVTDDVHNDDQDDDGRQVADDSDLRQENLRLKVALAKGLTVKQSNRLVGDTEEEMLADADELLSEYRPKVSRPQGKGDGGTGAATKTPTPADDFVSALGKALGQR